MTTNESTVRSFLHTLSHRTSADELDQFYHPDVEQTEYPNAITRHTAIRNLEDLKKGSEAGKRLLAKEEYEIKHLHAAGDTVILECIWTGTLAIPLGQLPAGGQIKAYFAQVFEFKAGKIFRQRNYDCFEPFS